MNLSLPAAGRLALLAALCLAPGGRAVLAAPGPFILIHVRPLTLTPATMAAAEKASSRLAIKKTLRLVVETGPARDMLSYRINSKRNPTLRVPRGAMLTVLFINTDDDMLHDIRFGARPQKYPGNAAGLEKASVGTRPLPHREKARLYAEELTLRAPQMPGKYAYFCTVRGHAQGGMAGTLIVEAN